MKKLADVDALIRKFEEKAERLVTGAQQGSGAWQFMKLGVISASRAADAVAKRDSQTRASYMAELVAQVCTGLFKEIDARAMEWGRQNEDAARACYEFASGHTVTQVPFVFKDETFRVGCSPDALIGDTKGAEIKSPYATENYIKFLTMDKIRSEYVWQTQFGMWVLDAAEWDVVQYDPRMKKSPIKILTTPRDEEKMKVFDEKVPEFIADMDAMLSRIGIAFGEHWKLFNGNQ